MSIDRYKVITEFNSYVSSYDMTNVKIRLKAEHTFRVAALCEKLSKTIVSCDSDLAWLTGMLHDIGRFEQIRRYNTFNDSKSIDHAVLGADLLFGKEHLIDRFCTDTDKWSVIEKSIRLHNVYCLPDDLTADERTYSNILRDADKIDIFKVNCEVPIEDISGRTTRELKESFISDEVYSDAMNERNADRTHVHTAVDSLVTKICFVYGLTYTESFRETMRQGYLDQMLHFESDNPDTAEKLAVIKAKVNDFISEKLK